MPLTRTRRRLVIAALAVVGILVAFWAWPSTPIIDPRFVGEWSWSRLPAGTDESPAVILRSDGTGERVSRLDRFAFTRMKFRWSVAGDQLILDDFPEEGPGDRVPGGVRYWTIEFVHKDVLQLHRDIRLDSGEPETLHRIVRAN
jgi:hypothetical protein